MNKKILIIDDERKEFERLKNLLEDGFQILPDDYSEMAKAVDPNCEGKGVKEYIRRQILENYQDIGLILCDIVGYQQDTLWGPDIIESIKQLNISEFPAWTSQVPIIALTQYADDCQIGVVSKGASFVKSKPKTDIEEKLLRELIVTQINKFEKYLIMNKKEKVFIVHGHDEKVKETVARFLEKLDFDVIILHEQPNNGDTIIEKIERYSDVSYAVVLYTGCDMGKEKKETRYKPRARQNVVFEHGYMISKLGRDKVCALVDKDVITPGDISGIVYIPLEGTSWKMDLAREMKKQGLDVDLNKL